MPYRSSKEKRTIETNQYYLRVHPESVLRPSLHHLLKKTSRVAAARSIRHSERPKPLEPVKWFYPYQMLRLWRTTASQSLRMLQCPPASYLDGLPGAVTSRQL